MFSSTATRPDPSWEFTDAAGHFHAWAENDTLPTLRREVEVVPCDEHEDCDALNITYYLCALCGEEVTPPRLPDSWPKAIRGRQTWTVTADIRLPIGEKVSVRVQDQARDREHVGGAHVPARPGARATEGG